MKASKNKKDQGALLRRMLLNRQIFHEAIVKDSNILSELLRIANLTGLKHLREEFPVPGPTLRDSSYFDKNSYLVDSALKIFESLDDKTQDKIEERIMNVIIEAGLTREWQNPLIAFVVIGILLPPIYSFTIEKEQLILLEVAADISRNYRTKIILGPDTTRDEILAGWTDIKAFSEKGWASSKSNLKKNSNAQLKEYIAKSKSKKYPTNGLGFETDSDYEDILIKSAKDKEDAIEKVNKYRKAKRDTGSRSAEPVKITKFNKTKTAREVSRELYGVKNKKTEDKLTARTRQRQHRLKS